MKSFKTIIFCCLLVLFAAPVFGQKTIIKFSHVVAVDTPKGRAAEYFKTLVEERSGNEIQVEIYPNSELFNDNEVMPLLMTNAIQMAAPSFAKFTRFAPTLQLLDLPFLFSDTNHLHRVLEGSIGQRILIDISKKNLVGLAFWDNGFKQLSANKPIISPEDAAGVKFRTMPSKVLEAQFKAVGANPQVLPFPDVYSALQQGVVDGAENPLSNFYTKKFYEVQTDLTLSSHGYLGYLVVTNKIFWKSLRPDQQQLIRKAIADTTRYENKLAQQMDGQFLEKIKRTGKTRIHLLTPEMREKWQEEMRGIYPQFYSVIGKDLIEGVLDAR